MTKPQCKLARKGILCYCHPKCYQRCNVCSKWFVPGEFKRGKADCPGHSMGEYLDFHEPYEKEEPD